MLPENICFAVAIEIARTNDIPSVGPVPKLTLFRKIKKTLYFSA